MLPRYCKMMPRLRMQPLARLSSQDHLAGAGEKLIARAGKGEIMWERYHESRSPVQSPVLRDDDRDVVQSTPDPCSISRISLRTAGISGADPG